MKRSHSFRLAAEIILALTVFFWLITSISGMMSGVPREVNNLIIMVAVAVLAYLAWKRPLLGGLTLCGMGVLLAIYFFLLPTDLRTILPQLLLMCVPMVVAGLIFIEADWVTKKGSQ
jgi:uncharacterized membrane protein YhhN